MEKQIPIYFDSVAIASPLESISDNHANIGRVKVRAFTKYGNRNGSYITDEVAEQLIASATQGTTPVIGFFDPESQSWASHTGPKLANGYGYVESFLGWEPFTDTDGITRDYAVFSVILFTDYFEEAQKILGENQSMELDRESIDGDWAMIDNQEYFVYTQARILGLCVIGQHEPCFSVSAFFSKNDDAYKTQYEKFSSLLSGLKTAVEEAGKFSKGGEQEMDENTVVEPITEVENPAVEEFSAEEQQTEEVDTVEVETEDQAESDSDQNEDNLQHDYDLLNQSYNELQNNYNQLNETYNNLQQQFNEQTDTIAQLNATIANYAAQVEKFENDRKNALIDDYESLLSAEEITPIRANVSDFSYEDLESKLAIQFANKERSKKADPKIFVPQVESPFASLIKNYKK